MKIKLHKKLAQWVMLGMMVGVCSLSASAATGTFIWTGTVDTDWTKAGNWKDINGNAVLEAPTFTGGSTATKVTIDKPTGVPDGAYTITNVPEWVQYSANESFNLGSDVVLNITAKDNTNIGASHIGAGSTMNITMSNYNNGTYYDSFGIKAQGAVVVSGDLNVYGKPNEGGGYGTIAIGNAGGSYTFDGGVSNVRYFRNNATNNYTETHYVIKGDAVLNVYDTLGTVQNNTTLNMSVEGGTLNLTSNARLGQFSGSTFNLTVNGGVVNGQNGRFALATGGTAGYVYLYGTGEMNLKSLEDSELTGSHPSSFNLGVAKDGSHDLNSTARVNIGADGIIKRGTGSSFNFAVGTVGALADWSSTASLNMIASTGKATTFDLSDATAGLSDGRTVTLNGALSGSGDMKVISSKTNHGGNRGALILTANNSTYSGNIELGNAILTVNNTNALGTGKLIVTSEFAQLDGTAGFGNDIIVGQGASLYLDNSVALDASQFTLQLEAGQAPSLSLEGANIDFMAGQITLDLSGLTLLPVGDSVTVNLLEHYGINSLSLTEANFKLDDASSNNWIITRVDTVGKGGESYSITFSSNIPEPSTATLGLLGLGVLLLRRRRTV